MRYPDSVEKLFTQIAVVSKDEFTVKGSLLSPPDTLAITDGFWRKYLCKEGCGGCCLNFSLDWLPSEYANFCEVYPDLEQLATGRLIKVNGKQHRIFTAFQNQAYKWCQLFDGQHCTIHLHNPLSCRIELIKFRRSGNRGSITKSPYGRAWAIYSYYNQPIMCEFLEFSINQLKSNDIPIMMQLLRWCDYFGIETYLPSIISVLEEVKISGVVRRVSIHNSSQKRRLF